MGFFGKQFIDVIQWTEDGAGVLQWRFPMEDMEIQNGAQLTVRESQMAVFVNEGAFADIFRSPGLYTVTTKTLPLLTNLRHWDKAFKSPFKSDVYFFSTRQQTNQRWGTQSPITIRDKDFGAIRLRANGVYAFHVSDPAEFHQKAAATQAVYTVDDLEPHIRNNIVGKVSDAFAESGVPFLDMAANLDELSSAIRERVKLLFTEFGLALDSFQVSALSLPDELQKVLDDRMGMNMAGDMKQFTAFQVAKSIGVAAANEGGGGAAGLGAGLGAGAAIGKAMVDALTPGPSAGGLTPGAPPNALTPGASASSAPTVEVRICASCGKPGPKASKFCPECGAKA